jgi:putative FmdB family regulatory protein
MPIYEYECAKHGVFELLRGISQAYEPGACPDCSAPSQRLISIPTLSAMARSDVIARDRNERSRYEPRVAKSPGSCNHSGPCNHGRKAAPGKLKAYTGKRPWVIEHA